MTPQTVVLLSFALSAVGALAVAPLVIKGLKRLKAGQTVLGYVTQHEHKTGTPTMGGIIFLLPVTVVCLVTMTAFSVLAMCLTLGFAVLGFLDDFIKVRFHRNLGLKAYQKIIGCKWGLPPLPRISVSRRRLWAPRFQSPRRVRARWGGG